MRIFSDPHIGRRAGAHTTKRSSELLDQRIFEQAVNASDVVGQTVVCAGDLFDKSHNREIDILRGMVVGKQCDLILAGNHDLANRENTSTSIEVVGKVAELVRAGVNEVMVEDYEDEEFEFSVIPHHSSQNLFDMAIEQACQQPAKDLVFLHCNFNNPFAQNDSSLNLTPEQAAELLKTYKYIVMGHEHGHRWEMDGRLLITGNTHPTSFGDISNKYVWDYSPLSGFTKHLVWPVNRFKQVKVTTLLESGFEHTGENFIEVVGEGIEPELAPQIAQAMQAVWDNASDELFMVRNNVQFKSLAGEAVDQGAQLENVTDAISERLAGTDLEALWAEHLKEANNA